MSADPGAALGARAANAGGRMLDSGNATGTGQYARSAATARRRGSLDGQQVHGLVLLRNGVRRVEWPASRKCGESEA